MRKADPVLRERRRAEILAAAGRCFAARGFHASSMDDVAAAAGVSLGLLYRYFANKEALVLAAAAGERAATLAALDALEGAPDVVGGLFALLREELASDLDPGRARLASEVLAEAIRNEKLAAQLVKEEGAVRRRLVKLLTGHQRAGRIRADFSPAALADVLGALFDGLPVRAQIFPDFNARASARLIERMVRGLLVIEPGPFPPRSARPRTPRAPAAGRSRFGGVAGVARRGTRVTVTRAALGARR